MINLIKENIGDLINSVYYMEVKTSSGEILTSGKITNQKVGPGSIKLGNWLSTDDKHFFNINSNKLIVNITTDVLPTLSVNKLLFKNLVVKDWMKYHKFFKWYIDVKKKFNQVDVFTDRDLSEADTEIKDFLYFLNSIPGITTFSSCCGHNKYHMYISFGINTKDPIRAIDLFQKMSFVLYKLQLENLISLRADIPHIQGKNYKTKDLRLEFYSIGKGNKKVWKALDKFKILWETLYE